MEKLGASTRSQAVALALETGVIGDAPAEKAGPAPRGGSSQGAAPAGLEKGPILTALLAGVVSLADVESGAIYFAEDGGMLLRLAAQSTGGTGSERRPSPGAHAGRPRHRARRARAQGTPDPASKSGAHPLLASPMTSGGRLTGVLALGIRPSRPTSRARAAPDRGVRQPDRRHRRTRARLRGASPRAPALQGVLDRDARDLAAQPRLGGFEPGALRLDQDGDAADVAELEDLADARALRNDHGEDLPPGREPAGQLEEELDARSSRCRSCRSGP